MAIFGAYMNPLRPERTALTDAVKTVERIKVALDRLTIDLTRRERNVWKRLQQAEPERRIEPFDMVWWMYFSPRRGGASPPPSVPGSLLEV